MIYFKLYDVMVKIIDGIVNIKFKRFKFIIVIDVLEEVWFIDLIFVFY